MLRSIADVEPVAGCKYVWELSFNNKRLCARYKQQRCCNCIPDFQLIQQDEIGEVFNSAGWMYQVVSCGSHNSSVICSAHFHASDFFYQWGRKLVKPDAEPTIFSYATPVMGRKPPLERCSETICKGESSAAVDCEQSATNLIPQQADITTSAALVSAQHSNAVRSPKKLSGHVDNLIQRLQE